MTCDRNKARGMLFFHDCIYIRSVTRSHSGYLFYTTYFYIAPDWVGGGDSRSAWNINTRCVVYISIHNSSYKSETYN